MGLASFAYKLVYKLVDDDFISSDDTDRHINLLIVINRIIEKFDPNGYQVTENRDREKIKFVIVIDGVSVLFEYNIIDIVRRKKINRIMNYVNE
jgi:hypothetical protein